VIDEWGQFLLDVEKLAALQGKVRKLNQQESMELVSLRFRLSTKALLLYENLLRLGEYGDARPNSSNN
jgi:hypothetical protein